LLLSFAVPGQALDTRAVCGHEFSGQLAFYESAFPLRALIKEHRGENKSLTAPFAGASSMEDALSRYAQALAGDPWLESFPFVLANVVTAQTDSGWIVQEPEKAALPLATNFAGAWKLHAISGGHPITLVGEWNGRVLFPLSAWADGRFVNLN